MKGVLLSLSLAASAAVGVLAASELKIDVTQEVECDRKTKSGDNVEMHYRGTLQDTGKEFDASYKRNAPFGFKLGSGQVIAGWDEGLLDMCIGEKRILTIPPEKGYGNRGIGPIPGGATLVFETELLAIKGVAKPDPIKYKTSSSSADSSSTATSTSTEGVTDKIASAAGKVAEAAATVLTDTDDSQEHNEL